MHISADILVEALRSQGLRITAARRAVCAVIAERHGQHLTAATILNDVRATEGAKADQSTVYRTLDALEEAGEKAGEMAEEAGEAVEEAAEELADKIEDSSDG